MLGEFRIWWCSKGDSTQVESLGLLTHKNQSHEHVIYEIQILQGKAGKVEIPTPNQLSFYC